MLIRVKIEDGPTKEELYEACANRRKVYFKIEGEQLPAIILGIHDLKKEGLYFSLMG